MIVLRLLWNRLSSDLVGEVLGQLLTVTLKSLRKSLCAGKTEPASGERPEVNVAIIISVIVDLLELDCLQDSASYLAVAVLKLSVTVETLILPNLIKSPSVQGIATVKSGCRVYGFEVKEDE
jgi:hypothetical protein